MPDVNVEYSQQSTLATKSLVNDLTSKIKSGVNSLADAAKGAAGTASLKLKSVFSTPDFPTPPIASIKGTNSPEEVKKARPAYAGAIQYPVAMKYFTTFEFFEYKRAHALETPKDVPIATVALPMPANLAENFNVEYQTPALGPVVGAMADSFAMSMRQTGGGIGAIGNFIGKLGDNTVSKLGESAAASLLANAKSINRMGETAADVASMLAGVSPNPHLAVIFSNVGLREHSFSYKFAPNNEKELDTLKRIIKQLKKSMLPRVSTHDMLFKYPNTCRIKFHTGGNAPYTIKQCVMKAMTVNYAPNGSPAFFKTGDPVMVEITMTFMEMSPFTGSDVEKDSVQASPAKVAQGGRPRGGV